MSYGFDYQFGSNGFDASGGYSETAASGAYGGYIPGQYDAYGQEVERINLKSDPNHGKLLRKMQGNSDLKMFVGGLSQQTTTQNLWDYFETFGKVTDIDIKTDPHTGASRGFGFVLFEEAASVEKVVVGGPHNLDGKRIDPKNASKNAKIFVGGLKPDTTDEAIKEYFTTNHGEIESFERGIDKNTNLGKPFAFVTMKDENQAATICKNRWHKIDEKQVECKQAVDNYQYKNQNNWGGGGRGGYGGGYGGYGGGGYGGYNAYSAPNFGSSYGQFSSGKARGGASANRGASRPSPY